MTKNELLLLLLDSGDVFSPSSITGLKLWLDANDLSTITKDGSNLVSQWNDKSGNGANATASGTAQATWTTNQRNGLPTINSNGTSNIMTGTMSLSGNATVYAVYNLSAFNAYARLFCMSSGVATNEATGLNRVAAILRDNATLNIGSYGNNAQLSKASSIAGTFVYTTHVFDGTTNTMRSNGVAQTGVAFANNFAITNYRLFQAFDNSAFGQAKLGELLVYQGAHNSTQIAQIEAYLKNKWGF